MLNIKQLFKYCPDTGLITRKITTSGKAKAGDVCKLENVLGYIKFNANGIFYLGHRVAWTIENGEIPKGFEIDHINHIKSDNRICNLRLVTSSQNSRNLPKTKRNKSGVVGISWYQPRNKWRATIMQDNKQKHLGYFTNKIDAINARKKAENMFNYHINHGIESEEERNGGMGSTDENTMDK